MVYHSTITKKGQVVVPKAIRDFLGMQPNQRIVFSLSRNKKTATIGTAEDITDLAGYFKPQKTISAIKARTAFEKHYERS